jgi:hypothetical protein
MQMRSILDQIASDIRQSLPLVPGDGRGFQGTEDSIVIVRTRLPDRDPIYQEYTQFDTLPPAQTDIMRVTYRLYWDEDDQRDDEGIRICYGVYRTQEKTIDPNPKYVMASDSADQQMDQRTDQTGQQADNQPEFPQPEGELYAPEIKYLRFQYYDGVQWRDRWNRPATGSGGDTGEAAAAAPAVGSATGSTCVLPQAVRITVGLIREPPVEDTMDFNQLKQQREEDEKRVRHADRFITTVYLPQSDRSLLTTAKKGSTDDRDEMGEQTSGGGT